MADDNEASELIADDDLCPICHLLLFDPVKTTCGHLMCVTCFTQWADMSATTAQSGNVEVNEVLLGAGGFDDDDEDALNAQVSCPMCRTQTKAALHPETEELLRERYPALYEERKMKEELEREEAKLERLTVLIGNRHRLVRRRDGDEGTGNTHDWTFFVRFSKPELVKAVHVQLHPTFRPPRVTITEPPFEIHRLGWGIFDIQATIELKAPYTWSTETLSGRTRRSQARLDLDWMLQFDDDEKSNRVRLRVKK